MDKCKIRQAESAKVSGIENLIRMLRKDRSPFRMQALYMLAANSFCLLEDRESPFADFLHRCGGQQCGSWRNRPFERRSPQLISMRRFARATQYREAPLHFFSLQDSRAPFRH